jgi:FKBP-type peptidyl-prolyl cis-trans isomerase
LTSGEEESLKVCIYKKVAFILCAGWDEGLLNACVGEKRQLIIPSGKAYGPRGIPGVIGEDATLIFNVEVLGINSKVEL